MGGTIKCVPSNSSEMDLAEPIFTDRYEWNNRDFTPDYGTRTLWSSPNTQSNWLRNYNSNKITKDFNPNSNQGMSDSSYSSMFIRSRDSSSSDCLAKNTPGDKCMQVRIGTSRYFSSEVTGLRFQWGYNRDGANSIQPWKWGFRITSPSGTIKYWGSSDLSRGSKGVKYTVNHSFDSTILNLINKPKKDAWTITGLMFAVGKRHGSGSSCRTSEIFIGNFRWKFRTVSGKKLLLPARRSFDDRNKRMF